MHRHRTARQGRRDRPGRLHPRRRSQRKPLVPFRRRNRRLPRHPGLRARRRQPSALGRTHQKDGARLHLLVLLPQGHRQGHPCHSEERRVQPPRLAPPEIPRLRPAELGRHQRRKGIGRDASQDDREGRRGRHRGAGEVRDRGFRHGEGRPPEGRRRRRKTAQKSPALRARWQGERQKAG